MKFIINKNELVSAISIVEKFVPSKTPMPTLAGIKFLATEDSLFLTATNLEMGIEYKIYGEDTGLLVKEKGNTVIESKILSNIIRRIDEDIIEFDCNENSANIKSSGFNMVLPCFNVMDFPEISKKNSLKTIKLKQGIFKDMIRKTIYARADEFSSRPQLTGVLVDCKDNILNMVALDGFRIAWSYVELDDVAEDFKVIVPGYTLLEISRIFKDEDESSFEFCYSAGSVEFATENFVITSRVLDGDFIDYKMIMNIEPKLVVKVDANKLRLAVEKAGIIARESSAGNLIKFNIAEGIIEVQAEAESGRISEKVACSTKGQEMLIAFNAGFFLDALKSISEPEIRLEFSDEAGPCIITPVENEHHKNFILPVRLKGEKL